MSSKISQLNNAAALTGAEHLPAVQTGGNVKLTPLQLANFAATVPAGMNSFRVLNFGSCAFEPNNNETMSCVAPAAAMAPSTMPTAVRPSPCPTTSAASRTGVAPSAERTPSSRVRSVTLPSMTP